MCAQPVFQWVRPPEALGREIEAYARRMLVAVYVAAVWWGQKCQNDARRNAPWTERTGNARSGIFFAVDGFGLPPIMGQIDKGAAGAMTDVERIEGDEENLIIVISHTVFYGRFLELDNGGRYAVIMSTIETNLPMLERKLSGISNRT
jgi:hypothetical protein